MKHAFLTIIVPFASVNRASVRERLDDYGNPAGNRIALPLDMTARVHFFSICMIESETSKYDHLILEASADGCVQSAVDSIAETLRDPLSDLLKDAGVFPVDESLANFMMRHHTKTGCGWFNLPGICFDGTPGMTVTRIRHEQQLAHTVSNLLGGRRHANALDALEYVRGKLWNELGDAPDVWESTGTKWAFKSAPTPWLADPPSRWVAIAKSLGSLIICFLWPLIALIVLFVGFGSMLLGSGTSLWLLLLSVLASAGSLLVLYKRFRKLEDTDQPIDSDPESNNVKQFMRREGHVLKPYQNSEVFFAHGHLASVFIVKGGWIRKITLRLGLWIALTLARHFSHPGDLFSSNQIHFARWFMLPGTDQLVFLSNYDGALESYVENFVELAAPGVNGIWSNTVNFPRTRNLIQKGALDGARLRRFLRTHQIVSNVWYSAYPTLTVSRIRANAMIRRGIALARTKEEAVRWLAQIDSAPSTGKDLELPEMPTLMFGGLSGLPHATCLFVQFSKVRGSANKWLESIQDSLSFGPIGIGSRACVVGFTHNGLDKLGLKKDTLTTLPLPLQFGMNEEWRSRALGDTGLNDPKHWYWGGTDGSVDAVVLLYARKSAEHEIAFDNMCIKLNRFGHCIDHKQDLVDLKSRELLREGFGFVDGISQPIIKGMGKIRSREHLSHVVEPGEFILGYPDNLGFRPATPSVSASEDALNILPSLDTTSFDGAEQPLKQLSDVRRDLGRNGTYLVIRQIAQNSDEFERFLKTEAERLAGDARIPPEVKPQEWIAAKIMGRWRNGSPLVRRPFSPTHSKDAPLSDVYQNDFLFGIEDPQGTRCPLGSHIRRMNPRESFSPGSDRQLKISNRHRILRIGRAYQDEKTGEKGIMFMCLNADLERQFDFLQQTWGLDRSFHGLPNESDPLLGGRQNEFTIPTEEGPIKLRDIPDFTTVKGGSYFFLPSRRSITYLAKLRVEYDKIQSVEGGEGALL